MGGGITLKSGTPIKLRGTKGVGIASDDLSWAIPVKINQSTTILYKQVTPVQQLLSQRQIRQIHEKYTSFWLSEMKFQP